MSSRNILYSSFSRAGNFKHAENRGLSSPVVQHRVSWGVVIIVAGKLDGVRTVERAGVNIGYKFIADISRRDEGGTRSPRKLARSLQRARERDSGERGEIKSA